jgi:hypothetical protein
MVQGVNGSLQICKGLHLGVSPTEQLKAHVSLKTRSMGRAISI